MMNDTEDIKEWRTQSVKHTIAAVLIMEKVPFSYDEENGIMFTAPESYVDRLIVKLITSFGCRTRPVIEEIK